MRLSVQKADKLLDIQPELDERYSTVESKVLNFEPDRNGRFFSKEDQLPTG